MRDETRELTALGNRYEQQGQHDEAETAYLRAISKMDSGRRDATGPLYINLGTNAKTAGRYQDAERYYRKAIDLLRNEKGDGFLQCAHAHYNLAKLLTDLGDEQALPIAAEAHRLYDAFPFTSAADRADAAVLLASVGAIFTQEVSEDVFREAWALALAVQSDSLDQRVFVEFAVNYLNVMAVLDPDNIDGVIDEFFDWASPQLAAIVTEKLKETQLAPG